MPAARSLPRGRHSLDRDAVAQDQRVRLLAGMAEAMHERGYADTPVADVLKRAGVSRQTFYELYDSKLACFLDAFDLAAEVLVAELMSSLDGPGDELARFDRALAAYLDTIAEHPAYARLFLVEVHAAGADAMARRTALQDRLAGALAVHFGARSKGERFACQVLVAAVASMITGPLMEDDLRAIRALRAPIVEHARRTLGG